MNNFLDCHFEIGKNLFFLIFRKAIFKKIASKRDLKEIFKIIRKLWLNIFAMDTDPVETEPRPPTTATAAVSSAE